MKALKGIIWLQIVIGFLLRILPKWVEMPPFVKDPAFTARMLMCFGFLILVALDRTLSKRKGE